MIISTISRGSLFAGDERSADILGEARPEHYFRITATPLYQTRIASNLTTGQILTERKAVEIRITWDFGCRGPHGGEWATGAGDRMNSPWVDNPLPGERGESALEVPKKPNTPIIIMTLI